MAFSAQSMQLNEEKGEVNAVYTDVKTLNMRSFEAEYTTRY